MSFPAPPSIESVPPIPTKKSSPTPPLSVSLPLPPLIMSSPISPATMSSPAPPRRMSSPMPPSIVSFPVPPLIVSLSNSLPDWNMPNGVSIKKFPSLVSNSRSSVSPVMSPPAACTTSIMTGPSAPAGAFWMRIGLSPETNNRSSAVIPSTDRNDE